MEWEYLKEYDLVRLQINDRFRVFPKWRFRAESFFRDYEQDFDSITLKEESNESEEVIVEPIFIREETVNHPQHYNQGKFEVIDVIEDWQLGFNLGNAIKYIGRAPYKGKQLEDLKKALWYLQREISRLENLEKDELEF